MNEYHFPIVCGRCDNGGLVSDFHSYNTRSSSHYRSQYARINTRLFSFVCTGPILWNRLPSTLKNTYTLASFKRNLKKISQCLIIGRISLFAGTKLILHSTVSCFCLFPYSYKTVLFYPMILFTVYTCRGGDLGGLGNGPPKKNLRSSVVGCSRK